MNSGSNSRFHQEHELCTFVFVERGRFRSSRAAGSGRSSVLELGARAGSALDTSQLPLRGQNCHVGAGLNRTGEDDGHLTSQTKMDPQDTGWLRKQVLRR